MKFDVELVGKIGSMALIDKQAGMLDYTRIARLSKELRPGYVWVTSGATETGRLDYINRNGKELDGSMEEVKADYSAQGQTLLMETYRKFVDPKYSIRQVLVEEQGAIPIVNYNDAVCAEENRKMEIQTLQAKNDKVVECVDNDETASQIACLLKAETLLIFTSADGIYKDIGNSDEIIEKITGKDVYEVIDNIDGFKSLCKGASRKGANGASAKLEYVKDAVKNGTKVIIANGKFTISEVLSGKVRSTKIGVNL